MVRCLDDPARGLGHLPRRAVIRRCPPVGWARPIISFVYFTLHTFDLRGICAQLRVYVWFTVNLSAQRRRWCGVIRWCQVNGAVMEWVNGVNERPCASGDKGLDWLYIQAANLYGGGVDKLPMDERRDWIKDRVELLEHSAADPLGPEGTFWQEAEDPWQCLAVCKEITNARASGDPTTYMCRLPVHQDGSCNGLQHYAALGRDEAGGEQVNLMPRDRPGDVYTGKGERTTQSFNRIESSRVGSSRVESNRIVLFFIFTRG